MQKKIYTLLLATFLLFTCITTQAQSINNITPNYLSYSNFISFTLQGNGTQFTGGVSGIKIINTSTGLEIPEFAGNVIFNIENDTVITGTVFPVCVYNSVSAAYQVNTNTNGTLFFSVTLYPLFASKDAVMDNSCFQSNDGVVKVYGNQSPSKERLVFDWQKDGADYFNETVDTLGYSELSGLPAGNYTITVTRGICTVQEVAVVNQPFEKIATLNPIAAEAYCFSNLPNFNLNTNVAGPFNFSYRVNNDTIQASMPSGISSTDLNLNSITTGENSIEILLVTDATNCTMRLDNALQTFTIYSEPDMDLYGNSTICEGDTAESFAGFSGSGIYSLTLSDGSNNFVFNNLGTSNTLKLSPTQTSTFSVVSFSSSDNSGCSGVSSDEFQIIVSPIPSVNIAITGNNPICAGSDSKIQFTVNAGSDVDVTLSNGQNAYNYYNIENGEEKTIFPPEPTAFFVTAVIDQTDAACRSGHQGDTISIDVAGAQFADIILPETYCLGDTILLTFEMHGVGPYDVTYNDGFSDYSALNIANGGTSSYIVTGSNTISLTNIIDYGLPGCDGEPADFVTLDPAPAPDPILYGTVGGCAEDTVRALGRAIGTGPFDITYTYDGNVYQTNVPTSPYFLFAHPAEAGFLTVTNVLDLSNNCKSLLTDSLLLEVTDKPQAGSYGFKQVCGNEQVDLFDVLTQPFDTTGQWFETNTSGVLGGSFIQPSKLDPGTYTFKYLVYGRYGCEDDSATVSVQILDAPEIINVNIKCAGDLTSYTVEFDINGNGASSFAVNGSASGTLNPSPPYHFKSVAIPSGTPYNFDVSNNIGCIATLEGNYKCDCENQAGRLLTDQIDYCEFDTAKAIIDITPTVALGDSLLYVVKEYASLDSVDYILSSSTPVFAYSQLLTYEQMYYIAALIIPVDGDSLNNTNPCLSISNAVPIIFHESEKNLLGYLDVNGGDLTKGNAYLHDVTVPKNYTITNQDDIGAESRYVISGVADGTYILEVVPDINNFPKALPLYIGNTPFWEEAQIIDKDCYTPLTNLSLSFENLSNLAGIGSINGYINMVDTAGIIALENARILLVNDSTDEVLAFTYSLSSGYYGFNNIPNGAYRIKVEIAGLPHISWHKKVISNGNNTLVDADYDVELGFGIYRSGTTAVEEQIIASQISIYPNPANNQISINGLTATINKLTLYTVTGQQVQTAELPAGKSTLLLNEQVTSGMYLVVIENGKESLNWRLTVMR
jgi:hypothetical protein